MRVIARTPRGLEAGEVLTVADDRVVAQMDNPPNGSIQGEMTADDECELARLTELTAADEEKCFEIIRDLEMPMDLVEIDTRVWRRTDGGVLSLGKSRGFQGIGETAGTTVSNPSRNAANWRAR